VSQVLYNKLAEISDKIYLSHKIRTLYALSFVAILSWVWVIYEMGLCI